jgi:hypothetical protein
MIKYVHTYIHTLDFDNAIKCIPTDLEHTLYLKFRKLVCISMSRVNKIITYKLLAKVSQFVSCQYHEHKITGSNTNQVVKV